jgi:hypothetical protein
MRPPFLLSFAAMFGISSQGFSEEENVLIYANKDVGTCLR